jgi:hypothetical protein
MIRCVYEVKEPNFPATDNHPQAVRYHFNISGVDYWVDAVGTPPTLQEVTDFVSPPSAAAITDSQRAYAKALLADPSGQTKLLRAVALTIYNNVPALKTAFPTVTAFRTTILATLDAGAAD